MIRRPPRSTPLYSSAASDVYKRQNLLNAPVGQISITSLLFDLSILLKSSVIGSEIILTNPLLIKQRPDSSFESSQSLTQSPHLIHFAFSNISPEFIFIFFCIGEFTSLPP